MHAFKSKFGQCQSIWQVANLHRSPSFRLISLSTSNADSADKEDAAFGLLESDPSSEFYERGKEKQFDGRHSGKSYQKEHFRNSEKKPHSSISEIRRSFEQRQALDKWRELKDHSIQKLSKNLVEDDGEEEYMKYFSQRSKHRETALAKVQNENHKNDDADILTQSEASEEDRIFGNLSPPRDLYEEVEGDEGDIQQEKYEAAKLERRHTPAYYGFQMNRLCKEKKLREAFRILEEEMPAVAAKPDHFCYQVLINACGRAGYTKKAFKLYSDMKRRHLEVQPVAYTGLFNACAESPWPTTDGLARAHKLRQQLIEKGYIFNQTISHAMIKAFGRCGDIKTAFQIVDEMLEQGLVVTTETINFMLQACITDKETGFRHALLVWRKMRELRLLPDIYSYNLLVRCVATCDAGDPVLTTQLLEAGAKPSENKTNPKIDAEKRSDMKTLKIKNASEKGNVAHQQKFADVHVMPDENVSKANNTEKEDESKEISTLEVLKKDYKPEGMKRLRDGNSELSLLPNLLGLKIRKGSAIGLSSLDHPANRLALLGGPAGFIRQMSKDRVTPSLATVTQMVDSLPPNIDAEESLLQSMKNVGLTPDTQFLNKLIRKRMFRNELQSAKDVLDLMQEHHLLPDIITFGCLALGCRNLHNATELLRDMDTAGYRPNLEIFTILVKNSIRKENYFFTLEMLKEMRNKEVTPDKHLLECLEKARERAKKTMIKMESGKTDSTGTHQERMKYQNMKLFLLEYKNWLKNSEMQLPDHPWAQYRYSKANA